MKTTEYLFGINPEELDNKFYYEALDYKLQKAKELYNKLYDSGKKDHKTRDRMFYVLEAVDHTRKLIEERTKDE